MIQQQAHLVAVSVGSGWGWPQWLIAVMIGFEFVSIIVMHGYPHGPYDAPRHILAWGAIATVLYMGGFWE